MLWLTNCKKRELRDLLYVSTSIYEVFQNYYLKVFFFQLLPREFCHGSGLFFPQNVQYWKCYCTVFTTIKTSAVLVGYRSCFSRSAWPSLKKTMTEFHVYCLHGVFFCVCDSYKPLQYSKCARIDPVDAIQDDQLSFQGSIHKGRGPPRSVSVGKSVSLL